MKSTKLVLFFCFSSSFYFYACSGILDRLKAKMFFKSSSHTSNPNQDTGLRIPSIPTPTSAEDKYSQQPPHTVSAQALERYSEFCKCFDHFKTMFEECDNHINPNGQSQSYKSKFSQLKPILSTYTEQLLETSISITRELIQFIDKNRPSDSMFEIDDKDSYSNKKLDWSLLVFSSYVNEFKKHVQEFGNKQKPMMESHRSLPSMLLDITVLYFYICTYCEISTRILIDHIYSHFNPYCFDSTKLESIKQKFEEFYTPLQDLRRNLLYDPLKNKRGNTYPALINYSTNADKSMIKTLTPKHDRLFIETEHTFFKNLLKKLRTLRSFWRRDYDFEDKTRQDNKNRVVFFLERCVDACQQICQIFKTTQDKWNLSKEALIKEIFSRRLLRKECLFWFYSALSTPTMETLYKKLKLNEADTLEVIYSGTDKETKLWTEIIIKTLAKIKSSKLADNSVFIDMLFELWIYTLIAENDIDSASRPDFFKKSWRDCPTIKNYLYKVFNKDFFELVNIKDPEKSFEDFIKSSLEKLNTDKENFPYIMKRLIKNLKNNYKALYEESIEEYFPQKNTLNSKSLSRIDLYNNLILYTEKNPEVLYSILRDDSELLESIEGNLDVFYGKHEIYNSFFAKERNTLLFDFETINNNKDINKKNAPCSSTKSFSIPSEKISLDFLEDDSDKKDVDIFINKMASIPKNDFWTLSFASEYRTDVNIKETSLLCYLLLKNDDSDGNKFLLENILKFLTKRDQLTLNFSLIVGKLPRMYERLFKMYCEENSAKESQQQQHQLQMGNIFEVVKIDDKILEDLISNVEKCKRIYMELSENLHSPSSLPEKYHGHQNYQEDPVPSAMDFLSAFYSLLKTNTKTENSGILFESENEGLNAVVYGKFKDLAFYTPFSDAKINYSIDTESYEGTRKVNLLVNQCCSEFRANIDFIEKLEDEILISLNKIVFMRNFINCKKATFDKTASLDIVPLTISRVEEYHKVAELFPEIPMDKTSKAWDTCEDLGASGVNEVHGAFGDNDSLINL